MPTVQVLCTVCSAKKTQTVVLDDSAYLPLLLKFTLSLCTLPLCFCKCVHFEGKLALQPLQCLLQYSSKVTQRISTA
jgi:hypothetical protein